MEQSTTIASLLDISSTRTGRRHWCMGICIVMLLACLARYWVRYVPTSEVDHGPETFHLARNLYNTGQFSNPFASLDTGPSAHLSPAFPAFLALLMRVFGDQATGMYAVKLAAALALSLQVALFPVFSRILGMGTLNGVVGATIWIVAKPRFVYRFEEFYAAILIAVACCIYRRFLDLNPRCSHRAAWALGTVMGLSILIVPPAGPIFAVWVCWEIWRRRTAFLKESLLPLILLPVLIIAPWTIRNYRVFHQVIPVRDDFGLELSVSNNDCAQFGIQENIMSGCFDSLHPNHNASEARKVLALGEPKYNELRLRQARHWIGTHPRRFIQLSALRFVAFWMPSETETIHYAGTGRPLERLVIYLMTLLSAAGLVVLYRQDTKSAAVCMSCLMFFPLVYYIVEFEYRYRYPILWVSFLLGALPITTCLRAIWNISSGKHWARPMISVHTIRSMPKLNTANVFEASP